MPSHPLSDFGADWRLKPDISPRTAGHRRISAEG
jgi:NAD(P)H dehydrogenase (quinone)